MDCFKRYGGDENFLDFVLVFGVYELFLILDKLLESEKYDGVCVLGVIIRGGILYFDYVSVEVIKGIVSVMFKYSMLVSFGVLIIDNIE